LLQGGVVSNEAEYANIPVHMETKKRIDRIASKGETYDAFITRLLDIYEKKEKK